MPSQLQRGTGACPGTSWSGRSLGLKAMQLLHGGHQVRMRAARRRGPSACNPLAQRCTQTREHSPAICYRPRAPAAMPQSVRARARPYAPATDHPAVVDMCADVCESCLLRGGRRFGRRHPPPPPLAAAHTATRTSFCRRWHRPAASVPGGPDGRARHPRVGGAARRQQRARVAHLLPAPRRCAVGLGSSHAGRCTWLRPGRPAAGQCHWMGWLASRAGKALLGCGCLDGLPLLSPAVPRHRAAFTIPSLQPSHPHSLQAHTEAHARQEHPSLRWLLSTTILANTAMLRLFERQGWRTLCDVDIFPRWGLQWFFQLHFLACTTL